ncbi:MAG: GGDEF domain-containing protein [Treponema sp.]|nr:GGDEF domain-containing protein [Treponema sp.]
MARKRIGLQLNSLISGYNIDVFNATEAVCRQKGYDLTVFEGGVEYGSPATRQQQFIYKHINGRNIDGLIITSGYYKAIENDIKSDGEKQLPSVPQIAIAETKEGEPYIYSEFEENFIAMIDHMVTVHGCRVFNIVSGLESNTDSRRRMKICLATLAKHGIRVEKKRLYIGGFTEEGGFNALNYYVKHDLLPTDCIICLNDDMAVGLIDYAVALNYNVPEDFRVIGFDDSAHSEFNHVTITSVGGNLRQFAAKAVDSIEQMWQGKFIPSQIKIPSLVKYRKSCGCVDAEDFETDYMDKDGKPVPYSYSTIQFMHQQYFRLDHDIVLVQKFFERQVRPMTIREFVPELTRWLPKLHIRSCAIVLFKNKIHVENTAAFELPDYAELLLVYEEGVKQQNDIVSFNPQECLYPENLFTDCRITAFVRTLYYNNFIYGYMVYAPENLPTPLLDTTYSMISHVFSSSAFYTEKLVAESHQHLMMEQLEKTNSQLAGISQTDELTKLYNRRGLFNLGQESINFTVDMGKKGLVFYADMDGLKRINDTYGHDAGDQTIVGMALMLRKSFRSHDIIARLGGDEFVIVSAGVDFSFVPKVKERIKESCEEWYMSTHSLFRLSISIGAVEFSEENKNLEELLSQADKVLYEEKARKHTRSSAKE